MGVLSQFVDHQTLAKLTDHQVQALNDTLEAALVKTAFTNEALNKELQTALKAAATHHVNAPR